jgi:hypothetical protein
MIMVQIQILKNNVAIRVYLCESSQLQATFNRANDIAGGLWNGTDVFKVIVNRTQKTLKL